MMHPIQHSKRGLLGSNFSKSRAILSAVIVLILIFSIFSPLRSLVGSALTPFFKTGNFFYESLGGITRFFSDKNNIITENKKLQDELQNNRVDIAAYESVKQENKQLREELKIKPAGNFITAAIISKPPQMPFDTLFLDGGLTAGVNNGNFVLAGERILIGKIVKVSRNNSTVSLNSFAGAVSEGFVARTNEPIEIKGGGGNMESRVPIDFDVSVGDKIISGGSVNYLIAVVGAIEEDRSSGFKNILFSMPVDVSKINFVFINV
jgi:cell shape-determining protein MreC